MVVDLVWDRAMGGGTGKELETEMKKWKGGKEAKKGRDMREEAFKQQHSR